MATDSDEATQLAAVRRAALPALEATGRVLIEDICVPRSKLPEAVRAVADAAVATGTSIYTFAHAADGDLHPIIVLAEGHYLVDPAVQEAADSIFWAALRLGGTVSGEHGVGILKQQWKHAELGEDVSGIQRELKSVFDPSGILDPGRAI